MSSSGVVLPLAEVQQAAAETYDIFGELGRGSQGHPVYLARERAADGRMVLLELRRTGRDPSGAEEYALEYAGDVHAPGSVTGRICPSCGATDPRSGRYCGRCRHNFTDPSGRPVQTRQELLEQVQQQTRGTYDILGEIDHAAGRGIVYLARDRASGAMVALRLQRDQGQPGQEEYALDVTRSLDAILSSVPRTDALGAGLGLRQTTFVRHRETPLPSSAAQAPADDELAYRRSWRRERGSSRPRALLWLAGAAGVLLVVGGAVVAVDRLRRSPVPPESGTPLPLDTSLDAQVFAPEPEPAPPIDTTPPTQRLVSIRLRGVPAGATILVDTLLTDSAGIAVPPGSHTVSVKAAGYRDLLKTVEVSGDTVLDLQPDLASLKIKLDPCRYPGATYNAEAECYDELPRRIEGSVRVQLPPDFGALPRPSTLWVRVSPEGRTIEVEQSIRSTPEFEEIAKRQAESLVWQPARKNGRPVTGWVEVKISPAN
jgi:hypothetical protein